jgi:hypothetical protein
MKSYERIKQAAKGKEEAERFQQKGFAQENQKRGKTEVIIEGIILSRAVRQWAVLFFLLYSCHDRSRTLEKT